MSKFEVGQLVRPVRERWEYSEWEEWAGEIAEHGPFWVIRGFVEGGTSPHPIAVTSLTTGSTFAFADFEIEVAGQEEQTSEEEDREDHRARGVS